MSEDTFWVKRSVDISPFGIPLVIFTSGTSGTKHFFGEYFILITGVRPTMYSKRVTFDLSGLPPDIAALDEHSISKELDQQVQTELSAHLHNAFQESGNDLLLGATYNLGEAEKNDIARLWLRGEHHEEIQSIRRQTQSDALREYLLGVIGLTPIRSSNT